MRGPMTKGVDPSGESEQNNEVLPSESSVGGPAES